MPRAGVTVAFALTSAVTGLTGTGEPGGPAGADLPALHAEPDPGVGGRIVDERGREVLLRGVNVNALAEYWKGTEFRTTFALAKDDPERMASVGWNAVRLLISWSRVEPEPGGYNERYLDRVAATVDRLAAVGIYTIIDLHQDAWGPTLAAGPNEACRPPEMPALGWDGAPGWATFDDGQPRCIPNGLRELSPAVRAAWGAFFADRDGIQTRYVEMLGHVARRFARNSNVAGFDVMNEPNAFGAEEEAALSAMYERAIAEIRAGEKKGDGFPHLVLFEPSAIWSTTGSGPPAPFVHDENVVYAPHSYRDPITTETFTVARNEANGFRGAPVLFGEWGADPERAGIGGYFVQHQRGQDGARVSATLWTWRESCGDPHKVRDAMGGGVPEVWGEFDVDCTENSVTGARDQLVTDLTWGYVRAAPGRLHESRYEPNTGELRATGESVHARGQLVAFHPGPRARDVEVEVHGLETPELKEIDGGGVVVSARPAGGVWTLTVRPRG